MCGIFLYQNDGKTILNYEELTDCFNKINHRGPDDYRTIYYTTPTRQRFIGFHRLSINDIEDGGQPFHKNNVTVICNGEIFNYKQLIAKYNLQCKTMSDCEVIIHMYEKMGFIKMVKELDGDFAIILIDNDSNIVYSARDPIGVRSLYMYNDSRTLVISSELKAMMGLRLDNSKITQFKPAYVWNSVYGYSKYIDIHTSKEYKIPNITPTNISDIGENLVYLLTEAVKKRLVSDRPIGCLLSGGLDSSLIASLLCNYLKDRGTKLKTFSVGLEGSPDVKYAREVAEFIGSDHHELILTEQEMIDGLLPTIYQLETYDTTTIRAGTPMYLLARHIKKHFDTTVIFSGEGSDELSGSYMYFHNAPSPEHFTDEIRRLVNDLSYFDVLRCDKSISGNGLEIRVPFLDKNFLTYYLSIDAKYKIPRDHGGKCIEKYLLRSAFDFGILPESVLWRQKEGMSDGVSSIKNSWYNIIQSYVKNLGIDLQYSTHIFNKPLLTESMYYRNVYDKHFPDCEKLIPYYWLPKWSGDIIDPSARVLNVYTQE